MTALASRAAGLRLTAIICLLLLPILLLSFMLVNATRSDIAFAKKELKGVVMVDAVMPALIGLSSGNFDPDKVLASLGSVESAARDINMETEFNALTTLLAGTDSSTREKIVETTEIIHEIGAKSGLILDPFEESFFLALTNIINLPNIISDLHNIHSSIADAIATRGIDDKELKGILVLLGNFTEALEQGTDSIEHAIKASSDPQDYAGVEALVSEMMHEADVTIAGVTDAARGAESIVLTMLSQQTIDPAAKYKAATQTWSVTSRRLVEILTSRLERLWNRVYLLLAIAGLCIVTAAGASLWMFRSTLKRLDLVEGERQRADAAREEAEAMGAKVAAINNDVSILNRDLADKMLRLKEAQDGLVEKGRMEQLGQLTATIAHEIRNPLGAVRTSAFLLEKKTLGKGLGVEAQIERINKGVTRCDNIINQLLDFSRNKKLSCQPERLDDWLVQVVEEEAARLPLAVCVECSLGLGDREVPFDPSRLRRAVVNLLSNASEAMVGTGEDGAKFHTKSPRISVTTAIVGENVEIAIADNGPGISPENLEKVREPLFTTKSFGTGLGVPAIEKILEQHGGFLKIESEFGKGATFRAFLPLKANLQTAKAA